MTSNAVKLLAPRIVEHTGAKCTATAILLHGSGGTGDDLRNAFNVLLREELSFPHVRIIYPTAPLRPYTLSGGLLSNVWFDRSALGLEGKEHLESTDAMAEQLGELISEEVKAGIPLHRIFVGGFSMGACMSLHLGYRFFPQLAGILFMSSFLYDDSKVYEYLEKKEKTVRIPPLKMLHGEEDDLVYYSWGSHTHQRLKSLGVPVEFVTVPRLEHSINRFMAQTAKAWIAEVLPQENNL